MNTYRVIMKVQGARRRMYDVDACFPGTAIRRALDGLEAPGSDVDVSCRLFARDVIRHYVYARVREVS